ncbi:discoidin domain-containing protein [Paenibacillus sp. ACRRX]|uniref:discoidin domain-containing protein n=1 Tax=Paenibacillus sp. ACRRX TaxID=2918206 RepID=UPI001EF3F070|nr:discoidin domain-containing protein [Paenibacillus sp. ACRRX]MCG7406372.1 discoidin domain-containing protein [Paenibacillus sp. ACRRX]
MNTSYDNYGGRGYRKHLITINNTITFSTTDIYNLIDGNMNSDIYFSGNQQVAQKFISFDFNNRIYIDEFKLVQNNASTHGIWVWQGSNDNSSWIEVTSQFTLGGAAASTIKTLISHNQYYRYYRLLGVSGIQSQSPYIHEFEFKTLPLQNKSIVLMQNSEYKKHIPYRPFQPSMNAIPVMSSATSSVGKVISSPVLSGYNLWGAFDGNANGTNAWASNTGKLGYVGFEFYTKTNIVKYTLEPRGAENQLPRMARDWTFEASNDGSTWSILDTQKNITDWVVGGKKQFIISNHNSYSQYRINVTEEVDGSNSILVIGELEMITPELPEIMEGWATVSTTPPTKEEFDKHGMVDLSVISEALWTSTAAISPTIEIITYVPTGNPQPTFIQSYDDIPLELQMKAIPHPELVISDVEYPLHGHLQSILIEELTGNGYKGTARYALSFDNGTTWETLIAGTWRSVDLSILEQVKSEGMTLAEITAIKPEQFSNKGRSVRFAYFLDLSIHRNEEILVDHSKLIIKSSLDDVKLSDLSLHLLNTPATLDLQLQGNKLIGKLVDADNGKVKYRIVLNDKPLYPTTGEFTSLYPSPHDISINIPEKNLLFNQSNTLRFEYQDYWGSIQTWQTTFTGTYAGLMFMNESGDYYSDTFGGILEYLDIGTLVAGQTSLEHKIKLKNQLGYDVKNLLLEVEPTGLPSGVALELSSTTNPFLANDKLNYASTVKDGAEIEFYVRLSTHIDAPPTPNGRIEIRAKADKA